ncbi:MAG: hypothetical protein HY744_29860 [Deltaproteobacteria bacterium]|nr:hypothetical protein [Deltaproteobacteria bacterium]
MSEPTPSHESDPGAGSAPAIDELPPSRPVLASEALMDDVAPVRPWGAAARWWCGALGLLFAALAFAPRAGGAPDWAPGGTAHYAIGAATLAAAGLPLSYLWRAVLMLLLALGCGALGILKAGPAHVLAFSTGDWGVAHLFAAVALPGALLFRARYRAYGGARYLLAAALLLALPFAGYALVAMLRVSAPSLQVAAGVALAGVALSLIGFAGTEALTGVCGYLAGVLVVAVSAVLGAEVVVARGEDAAQLWGPLASVAGFGAATVMGALGFFQLLAAQLWREAREVDLDRPESERPRTSAMGDWSTRK